MVTLFYFIISLCVSRFHKYYHVCVFGRSTCLADGVLRNSHTINCIL